MEKKYCFRITLTTGFAVLLMLISADCIAQDCVGCYDSQGNYKAKGSSWTEVYNGVTYDCVCDCRSGNGVTSTPRGSEGSINSSFETDFKLMLIEAFINFIFSDNSTTISDEERIQKERQIKEQQEELERINAENEKQRKLKDKLAQELHNKLMALYKMLPDSDSNLEQKLLTDYIDKKSFDGDSNGIEFKDISEIPFVELSPKTGEDVHRNFFGTDVINETDFNDIAIMDSIVKLEQSKYDSNYDEWVKENNVDIIKRLERPDPYLSALINSIKTKTPPPLNPVKKINDLQPGDVILVGNYFPNPISGLDMLFSWTRNTDASHTLLYLKEINGQKMFLDHQPFKGEKIITELEFFKEYGSRPMEVAQLIAQPVSRNNGDNLYTAAFELVGENEQYKYENPFSIFTGTKYGVMGDDMVCSEADRWALMKSGFLFPKTEDKIKKFLGMDFSPADYKSGYFYVTPFDVVY